MVKLIGYRDAINWEYFMAKSGSEDVQDAIPEHYKKEKKLGNPLVKPVPREEN